jgi:biopolymer transport protein ExbD
MVRFLKRIQAIKFMHDRMRLVSAGCLVLALFVAVPARSKPPGSKEVEYKRADSNFYFTRDVKASDPDAVILPETSFRQQDSSYFYVPRRKAPHEIYVKEMVDWLEPVTPPSMPLTPEGLGIAPDAMQIREPQGDVTVALPDKPSNFFPATNRMSLPDGAIVKTGDDGTTAVLLGGINSLRLAPNSQASVEQTVTPDLRSTRVDLKAGAAFSKVGLRPGAEQDYEVRTEAGTVKVKGTDFLTVVGVDHTNVFLVQGVVEFDGPDGQRLALAKSNGSGEPQIIQSELAARGGKGAPPPVIGEATLAFDFIPTVNVKVKALREKEAAGTTLTPEEKQYLSLLRRVPVLIKLSLVEPPPPPALEPAASTAPPPAIEPAAAVAPPAPQPAPPAPEKEVVKETPPAKPVAAEKPAPRAKPVAEDEMSSPSEPETMPAPAVPAGMAHIEGGELVTPVDLSTPGKKMTTTESAPKPKPAKPAKMAKTTPASKPAPAIASASTPPAVKAPSVASTPSSKPLKATLHADGTVDFHGQTLPTADFEAKLKEVMAAKPHKTLLLHAANDVPFADIKELIDAGKAAGLQEVKLVPDAKKTTTETATTIPAPLAPAQAMKTDPMMAPRPAVPPPTQATVPDAPAEDTAAAATAPVPAGPISPVKNDTVP